MARNPKKQPDGLMTESGGVSHSFIPHKPHKCAEGFISDPGKFLMSHCGRERWLRC